MNDILTFSIIALFLVVSPGPNIVLILKTVSDRGRTAGFLNVSGFVLAAFIHGALSILGLSAIIVQSAELFLLVKVIGSLYLFYLGVKTIYKSYASNPNPNPNLAIESGVAQIKSSVTLSSKVTKNSVKSFGEGFLTQMLNAKGSMFYLAIFPQFIDFQTHAYLEAFTLVSIHAVLMIIWFSSVCVIASNIKSLNGESHLGRWVQRISGGILITFSFLLFKQEVTN